MTLIWPGYSSSCSISRAISWREQDRAVVVERAGHDHHADLAAGLHGVDLVDAVVAGGDLLEVSQALDVLLERLAAGARPGAGERVGGLDDDGLDGLRLDLVVVGLHRVRDGLGLAVPAGQVAADERVRALDLVRDGLADVVQQRGAARGLGLAPSSVGHHRRQVRALDRVREHVLAVARAVLQAAEDADQLGVEALDVGVERRLLAGLDDVALELGLGLVVGLLDPGRVDAAVREELLERHAGDLAAHAVEAGQDHGVRRVVDDEVDAGEVLQRADVAALAADDAALHVVGGQLDDGHGRLGRVAGGETLHDDGEDVAHAPVGVALGLLLDLAHEARGVVADLVLELLEQHAAWPGEAERPETRSSSRDVRARGRSLGLLAGAPSSAPLALVELDGCGRRSRSRGRSGAPPGGRSPAARASASSVSALAAGTPWPARRAPGRRRGRAGGGEPGGTLDQQQRRDHQAGRKQRPPRSRFPLSVSSLRTPPCRARRDPMLRCSGAADRVEPGARSEGSA